MVPNADRTGKDLCREHESIAMEVFDQMGAPARDALNEAVFDWCPVCLLMEAMRRRCSITDLVREADLEEINGEQG